VLHSRGRSLHCRIVMAMLLSSCTDNARYRCSRSSVQQLHRPVYRNSIHLQRADNNPSRTQNSGRLTTHRTNGCQANSTVLSALPSALQWPYRTVAVTGPHVEVERAPRIALFGLIPTLTLVANSKMGAMNLFTPASEEQRNRVNAYAETPTSVDESRLERIRHQCQHSCYQPQSSYIWGSRSFGAKNNDLLQVFVFTGLLERLF